MQEDYNSSPFNALPPVVVALVVFILGIECIFFLGDAGIIGGPNAIGWRLAAVQKYAFSADIFLWMQETGRWSFEHLIRSVSFIFIHGGFIHAGFAAVMILAIGKMVGEVFSQLATLVVFVVPGIAGSLAHGLILQSQQPLIGAYPGVYGLIGAFTFLLWVQAKYIGASQLRAFSLIGGLLFIQLVFGVLFNVNGDWLADVAGFATGFGLSFFLVPGGWARIREILRRRG